MGDTLISVMSSVILSSLVKQDPIRLQALNCVSELNLPDCYLAAGFVRNLVWDHLHDKAEPTLLNDIDVIYFDREEVDPGQCKVYEAELSRLMPELNWQVRNQAVMHIRNGDQPYLNAVDAMSYWPEKETAVAVRKLENGNLECVSAFGFDSLFELKLSHNPKRTKEIFEHRVCSKGWLKTWPKLQLVFE